MKYTFGIFVSLLLFVFIPQISFAQEVIKQFDTVITAEEDGDLVVEEKIVYDFGDNDRHGIFRFIPLISQVGDLYRVIEVEFTKIQRDGKDEEYKIDKSSEQTEVKIGDADRTIEGEHLYTIEYTVANGIGSNYEDHDELYWNVTGNSWDVSIASASVVLKTDFATTIGETICFTGTRGSTERDCVVEESNGTKKITTTKVLNSSEGLTFVSSFPVNTFPDSTLLKDKPMDPDTKMFLWIVVPILIFLNFILAPILLFLYFKKKDKKHFGKPVVNFDLPKDKKGERITPSEAGTIDNTKLDKNDIIATIFDLAIRKYLRIEGVKTKGKVLGIGKKEDHRLLKLKNNEELNPFENALMVELFEKGDNVLLSETNLSYTTFQKLEKANFSSLITRGFYSKNPKVQIGTLLGFGIASLATINLLLGSVLIFLSRMLNGRTQLGDEMDWNIDGLKIFLKGANRYNQWQAKNLLTVEKMIPYAMSLGLIDEFMKQLKVLKPDYQPTWYRGTGNFYSSYPLFMSSMSSDISTSAPSSSSGFSGGSSGGGGGGGGGGSW